MAWWRTTDDKIEQSLQAERESWTKGDDARRTDNDKLRQANLEILANWRQEADQVRQLSAKLARAAMDESINHESIRERNAEIERLTKCISERAAVIEEKNQHIDRLQTQGVNDNENRTALQIKLDELAAELAKSASEIEELRLNTSTLINRNRQLEASIRQTHVAISTVLDEMECRSD